MKAVLSTGTSQRLSDAAASSPGSYGRLFGVVREGEGIVNIMGVGEPVGSTPAIGRVMQEAPKAGTVQDGEVIAIPKGDGIAILRAAGGALTELEVEPFDPTQLFARTPFRPDLLATLWQSETVVIGTGTGGSRIVVDLVRSGVGGIRLCDPGLVRIENGSRQECSQLDIGRYKVHAVGERIHSIRPDIRLQCFPVDVFAQGNERQLEAAFSGASLVIATTDRRGIQLRANREARQRRIDFLAGGCYEKAQGGEAFYAFGDGTTSCLECLRGGFPEPEAKGPIDYSEAKGPQDYRGEPGLLVQINLVTAVVELFALALLFRRTDSELASLAIAERNLILIGGPFAAGFHVFRKPFEFIRPVVKGPRDGCTVCHRQLGPREAAGADELISSLRISAQNLNEFPHLDQEETGPCEG